MANNVDYVFMCLFAICIFFSEKCLFMCNHFLIELFIFLLLSFESPLYISDLSPLLNV